MYFFPPYFIKIPAKNSTRLNLDKSQVRFIGYFYSNENKLAAQQKTAPPISVNHFITAIKTGDNHDFIFEL